MKIAVIGGGAAGLMTTWLLDGVHEVHLFERHPILGGNVRTLGQNVTCSRLEDGIITENGVAWFHEKTYPTMHRFLDTLGVTYQRRSMDSSIVMADGHRCHINVLDCFRSIDWEELWHERHELTEVATEILTLVRETRALSESDLNGVPLSTYINQMGPIVSQWIRGIVCAFLSAPFSDVGDFPADMIIPGMRFWLRDRTCSVLPDGIYSYMQKIVDTVGAQIHTGAAIQSVRRNGDSVVVTYNGGEATFDRIVIATTPECAFRMLSDATPEEARRLGKWKDNSYNTVAHTSDSFYRDRSIPFRTQCDCFERPEHQTVGYNCSVNQLYDMNTDRPYSFAAHLDDWIPEADILDVQEQVTPVFHVDATINREEIRTTNGENNTFFAGGYLIDGLHEGAICTALEVSEKLGGRTL